MSHQSHQLSSSPSFSANSAVSMVKKGSWLCLQPEKIMRIMSFANKRGCASPKPRRVFSQAVTKKQCGRVTQIFFAEGGSMLAIVIILNHFNTFHDLSVFVRPSTLAVTKKHHVIGKGELCSSCWLRIRGGGGAAPPPNRALPFFTCFVFDRFHQFSSLS